MILRVSICWASIVLVSASVLSVSRAAVNAGTPCRIGDPCSVYDPSKDDSQYPIMKEWALAGVQGGIPLRASTPVALTLSPGDDIQAAINAVSSSGGGVVLLRKGTYSFGGPGIGGITLKSNVILRGEDRYGVVLESHIRLATPAAAYPGPGIALSPPAVDFGNATRAGLEDLTLLHADVRDRYDECFNANRIMIENQCPCGVCDWFTYHVRVGGSNNWVDNCDLLWSGQCMIRGSGRHITFRDNLIDRALNKQGGNGYIIPAGKYYLFYNNTIRNIRHVTTDAFDKVVFINNRIEVDMNWHGGQGLTGGDILVERDLHMTPQSHMWDVVTHRGCYAAPWALFYKDILYNGKDNYALLFSDPDTIYKFCDSDQKCAEVKNAYTSRTGQGGFNPEMIVYATTMVAPRGGTFYPVKGEAEFPPVQTPTLGQVRIDGVPASTNPIILGDCGKVTLTASVDPALPRPTAYIWEHGDGTADTTAQPTVDHYFRTAGVVTPTVRGVIGRGVSYPSLSSTTIFAPTDCDKVNASHRQAGERALRAPAERAMGALYDIQGRRVQSFAAAGGGSANGHAGRGRTAGLCVVSLRSGSGKTALVRLPVTLGPAR